jgi:hypothetical protein
VTRFLLLALAALGPPLREEEFELASPSEVVALVTASCERCAWGREGREAAALALSVDGRYSQHLLLAGGEKPTEYAVALGALPPGRHRLSLALDRVASAPRAGAVSIEALELRPTPEGAGEHLALAFAPLLHPGGDSRERFTAVPLLLWYESQPTPRGTRIRYSTVLSGPSREARPDELMATRGRLTELLELYAVELDPAGRVLAEELLPVGRPPLPFAGEREGRHPLLSVDGEARTEEREGTQARYAPAPFAFGFMGTAQEAVMDAHPWSYRVMIQEAGRKGLLVADARQGSGRIPDPRRFVYVEACAELEGASLSLAAGVRRRGSVRWRESDAGGPAFRIGRSGCFRGAVALGSPGELGALEAVRFRAFAVQPGGGGSVRLTRVTRVFVLGSDGTPGPNRLHWSGDVTLRPGGDPLTLPVQGSGGAGASLSPGPLPSPQAGGATGPATPRSRGRWAAANSAAFGSSAPPSRPAPGSRRRASR